MYQPERLIDLWGAVARTAIKNRRTGYASAKHRDVAHSSRRRACSSMGGCGMTMGQKR